MTEKLWNSAEILERLAEVRETMARAALESGRSVSDITLMAVTKTVPPEAINLVAGAGVGLFGENRAQELCEKYRDYCFDSSQIHFIGALQTNKVRQILDKVSCIQSVESLHLAQEISRRACQMGRVMDIMVEVNIGKELSKAGVEPEKAEALCLEIGALPGICLKGLMTIPPFDAKIDQTRRYFDQMHKLFVDIKHKKIDNSNMISLSMGMSSDYGPAIEAGANLVRVGSGIFGKRIYPMTGNNPTILK